MTRDEKRKALATALNYRNIRGTGPFNTLVGEVGPFNDLMNVPDYPDDYKALYWAKLNLGLMDRSNREMRVKYVNALRKIVSLDCPKNKVGEPIVSDVDLLNANAMQQLDALLIMLGYQP